MNEGNSQIAQRGHDLRGRAGAQARAIFAKGDIAHIMETVLDAPMASRQIKETARTGLNGREVRDEVDYLLGGLAGLAHGDRACQASHLTDQRPVGGQIGVHAATDLDRADFGAPAMAIHGAVLLKGRNLGVSILEIDAEIAI